MSGERWRISIERISTISEIPWAHSVRRGDAAQEREREAPSASRGLRELAGAEPLDGLLVERDLPAAVQRLRVRLVHGSSLSQSGIDDSRYTAPARIAWLRPSRWRSRPNCPTVVMCFRSCVKGSIITRSLYCVLPDCTEPHGTVGQPPSSSDALNEPRNVPVLFQYSSSVVRAGLQITAAALLTTSSDLTALRHRILVIMSRDCQAGSRTSWCEHALTPTATVVM
jgi:hypothetical protein